MEKLTPITDNQYYKLQDLIDIFRDTFNPKLKITDNVRSLIQQNPGIYEITNALYNSKTFGDDSHIDMHGGNIMMRGNTPVFIDPLVD